MGVLAKRDEHPMHPAELAQVRMEGRGRGPRDPRGGTLDAVTLGVHMNIQQKTASRRSPQQDAPLLVGLQKDQQALLFREAEGEIEPRRIDPHGIESGPGQGLQLPLAAPGTAGALDGTPLAVGVDEYQRYLYEVTPDHHAILGPVEGRPGVLLATGFSGHGVMHAPAVGRCVAEMILRGRSESVDVEPLSLSRFARGALIHETMVL